MQMRLLWDRPARPASTQRQSATLMVGVLASGEPARSCDVCILLDTSKSMEGPKLHHACDACLLAYQALSPSDSVAVCTFATDVQTVIPLTARNLLPEQTFRAGIDSLHAAGCTLTGAALEHARRVLSNRPDQSRPATVLLMTDGHPTDAQGKRLPDVAEILNLSDKLGADGVVVVPVGLGSGDDFNVGLLEGIADRGRGQFCHAEDPSSLSGMLAARLERAQKVAVARATLAARPLGAQAGVEAACRVAPEYSSLSVPAADAAGAVSIPLGALPSDQEAVFLLRIHTQGLFGTEGRQDIVEVSISANGSPAARGQAALDFTNQPRAQQQVNEEAQRHRMMWEIASAQQQINQTQDPGRTGELLERIRATGELIGNETVVSNATTRLDELRATGALSGNSNARATAMLRATGELLLPGPDAPGAGPAGAGSGGAPAPTPLVQAQAQAVVRRGARVGQAYSIARGEVLIGRLDPPGTVPEIDLTDQESGTHRVSRRHARIYWEAGRCCIQDLGSTNGTKVNGALLPGGSPNAPGAPRELGLGDSILVGESVELKVGHVG